MRVVIVGNSENVLNSKLGKTIDSFDVVVRFNNFITKGFEEWVGVKTDYVWLSREFIDTSVNYPNNVKFLVWEDQLRFAPKIKKDHFMSIPKFSKIKPKAGHIYSSGISVIDYFNSQYDDTFIHGIADGGTSHYWDNKFKVFRVHKLKDETPLLDSLNVKRLKVLFDN